MSRVAHSPRNIRAQAKASQALAIVLSGIVHAAIFFEASRLKIDVAPALDDEEDDYAMFQINLRGSSSLGDSMTSESLAGDELGGSSSLVDEEPAPAMDALAMGDDLVARDEPALAPPGEGVPADPAIPELAVLPTPDVPPEQSLPSQVEAPHEPVVEPQDPEPHAEHTEPVAGTGGSTPASSQPSSSFVPGQSSADAGSKPASPSPTTPTPGFQPASSTHGTDAGAASAAAAGVGAATGSGPSSTASGSGSGTGFGGNVGDDGLALRPRYAPRPAYPDGARRRGEEGTVKCRLKIDREGHVVDVVVLTSSGFTELDDAAVRTLKRWSFESLERVTTKPYAYAVQALTFRLSNNGKGR